MRTSETTPVRADIQALRAVAVAAVVLFHLWPKFLTGGYVGVDVFFVISGYLISSHLLREVDTTGGLNAPRFWARRIRRLLPASLTVLAVSLVASLVVLPRTVLDQALREITASALYVQNWILASDAVDYLASDNKPSIVQHFWSLSVEEQFYFVWPLVIIGAVWVASRIGAKPRRSIAIALTAIVVLSFLTSVILTAISQPSAYFSTFTRAWEFGVGGLVAMLPARQLSARVSGALGWAGLAAIGAAVLLFDGASSFPGWIAALPVLGAALVIYLGGSQARWSPQSIARFTPIQVLGDISYSVYLWHWPLIIAFPYVFDAKAGIVAKVGIIALTVVLALLTKRFIEDPVRRATWTPTRSFAFMVAGVLVLTAVPMVTTFQLAQSRANAQLQIDAAVQTASGCVGAVALVNIEECDDPFDASQVDVAFAVEDSYGETGPNPTADCVPRTNVIVNGCEYFDVENPVATIAFVGDSHAAHLVPPMVAYAKAHDIRLIVYARSACSALQSGFVPAEDTDSDYRHCQAWGEEVLAEIGANDDIDAVVFANRTDFYDIPVEAVIEQWQTLQQLGKIVVAMRDTPRLPGETTVPECVELHSDEYDPCPLPLVPASDFMTEAAAATDVGLIDLTPYLCDSDHCHSVIGGLVVYHDTHHFTVSFSMTLTTMLGNQLADALTN